MQEHVQCDGVVIAPLILYSDQRSLSRNGQVSGYPVFLSIRNIACENRCLDEGHVSLAVLPVVPSTDASHEERLELFHACLNRTTGEGCTQGYIDPPKVIFLRL